MHGMLDHAEDPVAWDRRLGRPLDTLDPSGAIRERISMQKEAEDERDIRRWCWSPVQIERQGVRWVAHLRLANIKNGVVFISCKDGRMWAQKAKNN